DAGVWNGEPVPHQNSAILQHAPDVINFNGKGYQNIAFDIHPYDQWAKAGSQERIEARLANYFDRVRAMGVPIVVGEFGSENEGYDMMPVVRAMYETAVPRNIGRIVWSWYSGDNSDLTTTGNGGGHTINSCDNPTNLTELGKKVWDDTH
ncbi:MAG TPA: cellulase family glycosylhydrolase, partial [Candidatus Caenarcaniphilales bacterium]